MLNRITETATQPASAVPIVGLIGMGNWISALPEIINVLTIIYLTLLVIHKGFSMYKEFKQKRQEASRE